MNKQFVIERRFGGGWIEVDLCDCLVAAGDWADEDTDLQEIWAIWDGTPEEFAETWHSAYFDHFCNPPDDIRITVESQSTPTRLSDTWKGATISDGTLRPQDLIPIFLSVADEIAKDRVTVLLDSYGYTRETDWEAETETEEKAEMLSEFLNYDLWEILNDIAPTGTGFGAHPGDGACYGFWIVDDDPDYEGEE